MERWSEEELDVIAFVNLSVGEAHNPDMLRHFSPIVVAQAPIFDLPQKNQPQQHFEKATTRNKMSDKELGLPKATVSKVIKECLAKEHMRCSNDFISVICDCCVEFIQMVTTESNICLKDGKRTISPEHVMEALRVRRSFTRCFLLGQFVYNLFFLPPKWNTSRN